MKAEITMHQLWWNHSVRNFFFRTQAWETVEELMERMEYSEATYNAVFDAIDDRYDDLDDMEEDFYNESVEDLIDMLELNEYVTEEVD